MDPWSTANESARALAAAAAAAKACLTHLQQNFTWLPTAPRMTTLEAHSILAAGKTKQSILAAGKTKHLGRRQDKTKKMEMRVANILQSQRVWKLEDLEIEDFSIDNLFAARISRSSPFGSQCAVTTWDLAGSIFLFG